MPHVIVAAITTFAGYALTATAFSLGTGLTLAAFAAVSTLITTHLARRKGVGSNPIQSLTDRTQNVRLPDAPRKVFYGTAQFAPALVYLDTKDSDSERNIIAIYAVSEHDIERIESVQVGGGDFLFATELADLNDGNLVTCITGRTTADLREQANDARSDNGVAQHSRFLAGYEDFGATMDGAGLGFLAPTGGSWEALDMKATGIYWLAVVFSNPTNQSRQKCWNGVPQVAIRAVRGNHGFADGTARDADDNDMVNPASCIYDYLRQYTSYNRDLGRSPMLDLASFQASYLYNRAKGYECNGVFDLTNDPDSVVQDLLFASPGSTLVHAGRSMRLRSGYQTPVDTIGEDDILAGWNITPHHDRTEEIESVSIRHARLDFSGIDVIDTTTLSVAGAGTDGRSFEAESAFIRSSAQAHAQAHYLLQRNQESFGMSIKVRPRLLNLIPADVVQVDLPTLGVAGMFKVLKSKLEADLSVSLTLIEESPGFYDVAEQPNYVPTYNPTLIKEGNLSLVDDGTAKELQIGATAGDVLQVVTGDD